MSGFKILLDTNAIGRYLDDEGFAKGILNQMLQSQFRFNPT